MKYKIKFVDWWECDIKETFLYKFLDKHFDIELSEEPDFVICSCFGDEYLKYKCIKIFYTAENTVPDFNLYDYAIGFDHIEFKDRYVRYPSSLTEEIFISEPLTKSIREDFFNRSFCSFVVSNGYFADPYRSYFYDLLSDYRKIDSGGSFKNNIGYKVENKKDFLSKYKFNLAMENSLSEGYITEKIIDAFVSNTIPIYWGSLNEDWLNRKSYIAINGFDKIEDCLSYISDINENKNRYMDMLSEWPFINDIVEKYKDNLKSFFENIFVNNIKKLRYSGRRHMIYGITN